MNIRISLVSFLLIAFALVGCVHAKRYIRSYQSTKNFSFVIDDGTGLYSSDTQSFTPMYCGSKLKELHVDIGQQKFSGIEQLVESADLWSAQVINNPQCRTINPEPEGEYFMFVSRDHEVTLSIPYCSVVDSKYKAALSNIKAIIRAESDKHKVKVSYQCVRF